MIKLLSSSPSQLPKASPGDDLFLTTRKRVRECSLGSDALFLEEICKMNPLNYEYGDAKRGLNDRIVAEDPSPETALDASESKRPEKRTPTGTEFHGQLFESKPALPSYPVSFFKRSMSGGVKRRTRIYRFRLAPSFPPRSTRL